MNVVANIVLFVLTVLVMTLGVIAGAVALVSVITESLARVASAGGDRFAVRFRLTPVSPRLRERDELASVLSTVATPAGGAR